MVLVSPTKGLLLLSSSAKALLGMWLNTPLRIDRDFYWKTRLTSTAFRHCGSACTSSLCARLLVDYRPLGCHWHGYADDCDAVVRLQKVANHTSAISLRRMLAKRYVARLMCGREPMHSRNVYRSGGTSPRGAATLTRPTPSLACMVSRSACTDEM
jgi:hypothetical protein